jgi:hypothetical protein
VAVVARLAGLGRLLEHAVRWQVVDLVVVG